MKERRFRERVRPDKFITVYDYFTDRSIGNLANLSDSGAMLITPEPIKMGSDIKCRIRLVNEIMGGNEISFGAKCRWCRRNVSSGMWESGYELKVTGKNEEMISYLVLSLKLGHWGIKDTGNVKTIEMENRRKADRYEFESPLPLFEFHNYKQIGELIDISIQGVRFFIDRSIIKDDIVKCRVKLPRNIYGEDYLTFEARCCWSRKNRPYLNYESGCEIIKISEKDSIIILYLITHSARRQKTEKKYIIID